MRQVTRFCLASLVLLSLCVLCTGSLAQEAQPLQLVQTIPMPNVKGRIDHMDVDVKGQRLFVAGLENGSVEVVDLKAGKWVKSISGFQKPQGIAYVAALDKLFIASADDAMVRVYRGQSLDLLDSIQLEPGPNRVAFDSHRKLIYVGYDGKNASKDHGEVAIIEAKRDMHLADIGVGGHPAELLLTRSGKTLYAFLPVAGKIQVIDVRKRQLGPAWQVSSQRPGDGALDESTQRLVIGTRSPPQMVALDALTGKEMANLPTMEGMDGVYFDATHKRVYVSGGRGFDVGYVFAYQQKDADHYKLLGKIPTRPGAGTSFWSPQLNRYFVAAPAHNAEDAAILVFEPVP
jgi:DNA-binding beta-propeller fold protein YncE